MGNIDIKDNFISYYGKCPLKENYDELCRDTFCSIHYNVTLNKTIN